MGFLVIAVLVTLALKHGWEKGKGEYAHTRDTHAANIARAHPDWSDRKIQRHARRRARGYWWDQIRQGFPDLKAAYEEDRLAAEEEHAKASLEGEKRRRELRDRIRAAVEEAHRLREEERRAEEARRAAAADPTRPGTAGAAPESTGPAPDTMPATGSAGADPTAGGPSPDRPAPPRPTVVPEPAGDPSPEPAAAPDTATDPETPRMPEPGAPPTIRLVPSMPDSPEPSTAAGGTMTETATSTSTMGDAHGYEQILSAFNADIDRRTAEFETLTAQTARLEDADAAYEQQMAMLRAAHADDDTIADVARLREANEQQIATARQQTTAAHDGLTTATAARDNWVSRHGSVYEVKASTGARGDEALYT